MNGYYLDRWNSLVNHDDIVYHLGDLCWNRQRTKKYLSRLNGEIHIVPGNHDKWLPKNEWGIIPGPSGFMSASGKPVIVHEKIFVLQHDKKMIAMCHYPMRSWPHSNYKSYHLHAHSHGKMEPHGLMMDVGVDTSGGSLYSWEYIKKHMEKRKVN